MLRRLRWPLVVLGWMLTLVNVVAYVVSWRFTHASADADHARITNALADAGLLGEEVVFELGPERSPVEAWVMPSLYAGKHGALYALYPQSRDMGMLDGDTALLVASEGGTPADLLKEAVFFHRRGFRVIVTDLRTRGTSDGLATTWGFREAERLRDLVSEIRVGEGRLVLVGTYTGAAAILRAVGELGVEADRLILTNPFEHLRSTVTHRLQATGPAAAPLADMLLFWGGVQHGFEAGSHEPVRYARGVRVPTLLMASEDPWVVPGEVRAIRVALDGPSWPVVLVPNDGGGLVEASPVVSELAVESSLEPLLVPTPSLVGPGLEPDFSQPAYDACINAQALLNRRAGIPPTALAERWAEVSDPSSFSNSWQRPCRPGSGDCTQLTPKSRVVATGQTPETELLLVDCVMHTFEPSGEESRSIGSGQVLIAHRAGELSWSEVVGYEDCCGFQSWYDVQIRWVPKAAGVAGAVVMRGTLRSANDARVRSGTAEHWFFLPEPGGLPAEVERCAGERSGKGLTLFTEGLSQEDHEDPLLARVLRATLTPTTGGVRLEEESTAAVLSGFLSERPRLTGSPERHTSVLDWVGGRLVERCGAR